MRLGDWPVCRHDCLEPAFKRMAALAGRLAVKARGARVPVKAVAVILQFPDADIGRIQRQVQPLRKFEQLRFAGFEFVDIAGALAKKQGREEDRHDDDAAGSDDDQAKLKLVRRSFVPSGRRHSRKLPAPAREGDLAAERLLVEHIGAAEEGKGALLGHSPQVAHRDRKMVEMRVAFLVFAIARGFEASVLVEHILVDVTSTAPQILRCPFSLMKIGKKIAKASLPLPILTGPRNAPAGLPYCARRTGAASAFHARPCRCGPCRTAAGRRCRRRNQVRR
ncbi:hypothetical protein AJ87_23245 [Rhizobium yanglingense]|nr:hypothetical protein AJ87_23245 [Rhizobium yanglingense]